MSPTATIPLFGENWMIQNVKHRLINPPPSVGKYRYEVYGQPAPLFRTNPDHLLTGHVIAIEGELKAAITYCYLQDFDQRVVGLPSINPQPSLLSEFNGCDRITLILDPGAESQAKKIADALGGPSRVRVLIPPMKIDDGILSAHLSGKQIKRLFREAVPV
jgi:hypothetical protein